MSGSVRGEREDAVQGFCVDESAAIRSPAATLTKKRKARCLPLFDVYCAAAGLPQSHLTANAQIQRGRMDTQSLKHAAHRRNRDAVSTFKT